MAEIQAKKVGFIGTGVMGRGMIRNIRKAGYAVTIYNRTKNSAEELIAEGAKWVDSVADVASKCDIVITIVGYPKDVEEVYFGEKGILANARPNTILVDMTTSSPILAKKIYDAAQEKGLRALDAPVSGGDIGARDGKLVIMVGGDHDAFEEAMVILKAMGTNVILQGPAGAGQYTKMSNQITIATNMIGVAEAMAYAKKSGLDPKKVLESIGGGAAGSWSLSNLGPKMIDGNFDPGFYIKHMIKDLKIAIESATEMGLKIPGVELSLKFYEELAAQGDENSGTQAIYKQYVQ